MNDERKLIVKASLSVAANLMTHGLVSTVDMHEWATLLQRVLPFQSSLSVNAVNQYATMLSLSPNKFQPHTTDVFELNRSQYRRNRQSGHNQSHTSLYMDDDDDSTVLQK